MVDEPRSLSFVVSGGEAGQRIDRVLVTRASGWGRRRAARLFESGGVTIDGRPARKGDVVRAGQQVVARLAERPAPAPAASLETCLVTRDVVIVDKPWGMPSAPLPTSSAADVATTLVARFPEMANVGYGPREPGLVHRLDTFTSGLLLAARSMEAFSTLRRALGQGRLRKRYLCVVEAHGLAEAASIDQPLKPHPKNKQKVVVDPNGRISKTSYRIAERHGWLVLLEVRAGAAYRHQVRVHLASIGHPLIGDRLYGGASTPLLAAGRHALHASYLACKEPGVDPFEVRAPLPEDMRRLLLAAD